MDCPKCGGATKVIDTRYNRHAFQKKRRRVCLNDDCGERFTTVEKLAVVDEDLPLVIKRDGRREKFSEGKIKSSLKLALVKRPVSSNAIDTLIHELRQRILVGPDSEINSDEIGLFIMQELNKIDSVAYIRFASVYRNFKDVGAFKSEIDKISVKKKMLSKPGPAQLDLFSVPKKSDSDNE